MSKHKPFRIKRSADRQFYVLTIAPNGKILSKSENYKRRRSAYAKIKSVIGMFHRHYQLGPVPTDVNVLIDDQTLKVTPKA